MILVDAIYTNHSGSMRLLEYFIRYLDQQGRLSEYFFLFDRRLKSDVVGKIDTRKHLFLRPSESARRLEYRNLSDEIKSVFCFGSVPPPVVIKDRPVTILQHNLLFFETPGYSWSAKLFYLVKRLYIRSRCHHSYRWLVQTSRVKQMLIKVLSQHESRVIVKPFFEIDEGLLRSIGREQPEFSFIYPADGIAQKNHRFLFRVWEHLKENYGLRPELHLTIPSKFPELIEEVETLRKTGLNIINHGFVSHAAIRKLYAQHKYLLFPSLSESFGLPLIEAAYAGLIVIGSDLPYIFEVIKPSTVFDPHNVESLVDIMVALSKGLNLPPTEVLVKDNISEVVEIVSSTNPL